MNDRIVRIGGACGAWGDSPMGTPQLLGAEVDYLMMDYLAEVTMSLLARARLKDPEAGYPADFVTYLQPHLAEIAHRGIKVVSNAGGVHPRACKRALEAAIAALGLTMRVAVVEGDDLLPIVDALRAEGTREWIAGTALPPRLLTANAYLGALPIAAALAAGTTCSPPAAWSATCWSADRRPAAACSPTGSSCPDGTTSAIRSPNAAPMAHSSSPSLRAPAAW
jgi:hypothetical protein